MIKFFLQRPKVNIDIKCIISINSTVLATKWYICLQFSIKHNSLLIPIFFFLWPAYLMTFPLPVLTLMTSLWFFCTHSRLATEDICIISTEQSEEHSTKMKKELLLLLPALLSPPITHLLCWHRICCPRMHCMSRLKEGLIIMSDTALIWLNISGCVYQTTCHIQHRLYMKWDVTCSE